MTQQERGAAFRALHEGAPFILPNPWDRGSARDLEALGFRALATTSAGFAYTLGRQDGEVTLAELADHVRELVSVTTLPLSVDLENGFGPAPEDAAAAIASAAEAGAVGGSIEDWDPDDERVYPLEQATERVAAAVAVARALPFDFVVTARAENHFRKTGDLADTIARLQAFEAAGADVLYAPGLRTVEEIRAIREATCLPLNVLARADLSFDDIVGADGHRVSLGSWLSWVGRRAVDAAARAMLERGDFSALG